MNYSAVKTPFIACSAALLIFLYCQAPVDVQGPLTSFTEIESVWQYLKAYSIYQDRVPSDPFVYSSSLSLLLSIQDTLKGDYYTRYGSEESYPITLSSASGTAESAGISATASLAPGANSTVIFDSLTNSTALITIWTFDSACVYSDFIYYAAAASRFPNLIINVRNNRGGYINQADSIIAALVPAGTRYIEARERDYDASAKKFVTVDWHSWVTQYGPRPEFQGKRFAVLINGKSASASEFVAAALYEGDTTTRLIGQPSYGKAMGQVEIVRRRDIRYVEPNLIRRPLYITYLQLRGVSPRIAPPDGEYHHTGVQPDTIPQAYVSQASGLSSDWRRQIFYAVKMLDSTATPGSINYPPEQRDSLGLRKTAVLSGLLKVVYEE